MSFRQAKRQQLAERRSVRRCLAGKRLSLCRVAACCFITQTILKMSTYENYNNASQDYDKQRVAVGYDVMAAMIQFYTGKRAEDLNVLDAGCGTGNYTKALIEIGVGQISLLDASSGMLEKARAKLSGYMSRGIVRDIVEAKMPPIPFPDDSFDAVMFNVVLNHLDQGNPAFPKSVQTLKESRRVLLPNGVVVVSTMLPSAFSKVMWFSQINEKLTERFIENILPSAEQFEKMFKDAGIRCIQKMNILGSDIYKSYYDIDGPLDEAWRRTSSYWTFATDGELDEVVQKVKDLKEKGQLENWVKKHDHSDTSGILTIYICKPLSSV
ncbi:ubiquinone/menaquinone biosynthesis C-methyltransferase UbiE-like [Mercenaria mercenaria]|uniref:ubiquinone/menaquinone biosynthesis C-methyltransferase UbiE-like n=1 Tax=Mercenaria mercenaria TaxID=6596 RepID=UPI00234F2454|nr:ubiquinone/menaquinone biosynthesis C-methyltransferase UbiE-like [Mercenaria mercenaria]